MNWLEQFFNTKILIGFGVGVLTASLFLIPTLKEQNQDNSQNQKMKLSTKSLPSIQDLKQVYIKKNEKQQFNIDSMSNDRKKNNKNSLKTETNQQDFYFNLDDGIRKKRKLQDSNKLSSHKNHLFSSKFNDNTGLQNMIQQNNIKNQYEADQYSKNKQELHQFSVSQRFEQIQENVSDSLEQQIQDPIITEQNVGGKGEKYK